MMKEIKDVSKIQYIIRVNSSKIDTCKTSILVD